MKYTFTTTATDGTKLYPMAIGDSPMDDPIGKWTADKTHAITWQDQCACENIMSYYGGTELVKIDDAPKCKCFVCTHKDPKERIAYYQGYVDASNWFLEWAKWQKVGFGPLGENSLESLHTQMRYNKDEMEVLMEELKNDNNAS